MKTALVSLHANRPKYSTQVLDAMDHQSSELFHIASLEDSCIQRDEIKYLINSKKCSYSGLEIIYNNQIPHTNNNLINALKHLVSSKHGFDAYIYMEDDTLFSKGAVSFLMNHLKIHKDNPRFSHVAIGALEDNIPVTPKNLSRWRNEYDWCALWGYAAPIRMAHKILELTIPPFPPDAKEKISNHHSLV